LSSLPDRVLDHLQQVADWPDLSATKYEPIEKIGQGGMASVYLARDRELDRHVAIKVLSDLHADPNVRARMLEEARIISRLEHPGIVPIHDSGTLPDGRIYFAMKWVRGRRLDELSQSEMPLTDLLTIVEKIGQTVAFAHAHGVIHRDLKPQNIMVGPFGEVLVMDWGVAKQIHAPVVSDDGSLPRQSDVISINHNQTVPGAVLGTPGYMAPEQIRGEVNRIDERTDVYGLGGILYFLLTRRAPGEKAESESPIVALRSWNPAVPRPLEAICLKALAPDPENRYASVADLLGDIASFRAHQKVKAYPEGFLTPVWRFVSKYRVAILLILAYLVVRITIAFLKGF
jgi:serine/threonine protein kinase